MFVFYFLCQQCTFMVWLLSIFDNFSLAWNDLGKAQNVYMLFTSVFGMSQFFFYFTRDFKIHFDLVCFEDKVKLLWSPDHCCCSAKKSMSITQKVLKVSTPNLEYLPFITRCSCNTRSIICIRYIFEVMPLFN